MVKKKRKEIVVASIDWPMSQVCVLVEDPFTMAFELHSLRIKDFDKHQLLEVQGS